MSTFYYFAYGSNLLAQRIHINNPSAVRVGIGKLKDYRLDFITYSTRWKGASATIVSTKGRSVWGAIWEISKEHLPSLDEQEGVADKIYFRFNVDIEMPDGATKECKVYQQTATPTLISNWNDMPRDRKPSAVYLKTMIRGAKESGLPEEYQKFLNGIPHNGYEGEVDIRLNLADNNL